MKKKLPRKQKQPQKKRQQKRGKKLNLMNKKIVQFMETFFFGSQFLQKLKYFSESFTVTIKTTWMYFYY